MLVRVRPPHFTCTISPAVALFVANVRIAFLFETAYYFIVCLCHIYLFISWWTPWYLLPSGNCEQCWGKYESTDIWVLASNSYWKVELLDAIIIMGLIFKLSQATPRANFNFSVLDFPGDINPWWQVVVIVRDCAGEAVESSLPQEMVASRCVTSGQAWLYFTTPGFSECCDAPSCLAPSYLS